MAKEKVEVDPSVYLTKPATDLQERFADWILEAVGYDPSSAKSKEAAFREGVRIATATRMVFQASPENREANAARKAEKAEAPDEDEAPRSKTGKKAGKGKLKAKPVVVEEDEDDDAEEVEEAPAPKPKKVAKKGGKRTRRAASADDDEAPF